MYIIFLHIFTCNDAVSPISLLGTRHTVLLADDEDYIGRATKRMLLLPPPESKHK